MLNAITFTTSNVIMNRVLSISDSEVPGNDLSLQKVHREHIGKYLCIAHNGILRNDTKITDLQVLCKYLK